MKLALLLLALVCAPAHAYPEKPVRAPGGTPLPIAEAMAMAPGEFARFVQREIENAERIARSSGLKAQ